jgi:hypothetical protein
MVPMISAHWVTLVKLSLSAKGTCDLLPVRTMWQREKTYVDAIQVSNPLTLSEKGRL